MGDFTLAARRRGQQMTVRQANLLKIERRCLKCGRPMWTDRCHRICVPCSHSNEGLIEDRGLVASELRPWLRSLAGSDGDVGWTAPPRLAALFNEG